MPIFNNFELLNLIFILIWSTNFTFGLHSPIAIVVFKFIVHNSEGIILILCSQSNLGAKMRLSSILTHI